MKRNGIIARGFLRFVQTRETDSVRELREYMTRMVCLVISIIAVVFFLAALAGRITGIIPTDTVLILALMSVLFFAGWLLIDRGLWYIGGILPPLLIYFAAVYGNYIGGIDAPAMLLYVLAIVLTGMMYGIKPMLAVFVLSLASYLLIGSAHHYGYIVQLRSAKTAFANRIAIVVAVITCIALLLRFLVSQFQRALRRSIENAGEIGELAKKNEVLFMQAQWEIAERERAETLLQRKNEVLTATLEELEASELRFKALSEQSLMAIIVVQEGRIQYTNRTFSDMSGYSVEELMALGPMAFLNMIHPDDRPLMMENIRKKISGEVELSRTLYRAFRKDGSIAWLDFHTRRIVYDGKPAIYGVIADRTMEKKNEMALHDLLGRYTAIMENAHEVIMVIQEMKVRYMNPQFTAKMGYRFEEILQMQFLDLVRPEDRDLVLQNYQGLLEGRHIPPVFSFRVMDSNGSQLWVETHTTAITWEGRPAVLSFLADITERVIAEESLRRSEERYRSLVETSPDPIIMYDLRGNFIAVNRNAAESYGFNSVEEFLAEHGNVAGIIYEEDRLRALDNFRKTLVTGFSRGTEYRVQMPSGELRPVEVNSSVLKDANGEPYAFISIVRDITERKKTEEVTRNSLKEKEVLLKEIHHRVKNNFQVIVSLLGLQLNRPLSEESKENLRDAQNRIRAMSIIHEKLYKSDNLAMIDFSEYLRTMSEEVYRSQCSDPSKVTIAIDANPMLLAVDMAIPLGLAVSEILTNALKYAFPDSRSGTVTVQMANHDGRILEVRIQDDGVGLPDGVDHRLGQTLGLKLVHLLVRDQLGGSVAFRNDGGTCITLTVPMKVQRD
ncbi:MAG: PAS domain S-box protein [Spirochaetes bacterium]|nr:PAS domain S-box protein [Spirochaetota bacterium]